MTADPELLADRATRLRAGDEAVTDYVAQRWDRIDDTEEDVRAWVDGPKHREWVHREAAALEARYPDPGDRPPLYGVPVGVKDIFHVTGLPTRAGSSLPPGRLAGPQAAAVTALREAGALVAGKTHTTEFAYFEPGPTGNPHDPDHTPGGSSSGSAAAVAAGHCPLALGTQTIGSTVRPAAFCGIVGFKPSYGRIPLDGVIPLSSSVDHVGLFTADVSGAALAASVCLDDWDDEASATVADRNEADRPTLGVPDGPYLEQASTAGREAFEAAVETLDDAGYRVRRVTAFEDVAAINERHRRLVAADAAVAHHGWFEAFGDRYAEATAELVEEGRATSVADHEAARYGRENLRTHLHDVMDDERIDVWITPGAPGPAPEGIDSTGDPVMNLPWTHAGLPTVGVPAGRVDGLPVGLQCAGRFGADERLLAWTEPLADAITGAT